MRFLFSTVFVLELNVLCSVSWASPLMDLKDTVEGNALEPVLSSACTPSGRCWGLLPIQEVRENIVPDDMLRLHARRQVADTDSNTVLASWNENIPVLERDIRPSLPTTRQIGSRVTKKDVFVSRGWSAGGMPFSVLYMNPHGPRGNHAGTAQSQEAGKVPESSPPPLGHPNYRIALRNSATGQPRRQYSIIPQLYISYGWGSFGK